MLSDGSLSLSKFDRGEGKYSMTMDVFFLKLFEFSKSNNLQSIYQYKYLCLSK